MPQQRTRASKSVITEPMREVMERRYISPMQLAEMLGVPIATVYQWNSAGSCPPRRSFGRHTRYLASDVQEWLDERHVA